MNWYLAVVLEVHQSNDLKYYGSSEPDTSYSQVDSCQAYADIFTIYIYTCFDVNCDITLNLSYVSGIVSMFLLWLLRVKCKNGELAWDQVKRAAQSRSITDPLRWSFGKCAGCCCQGEFMCAVKRTSGWQGLPQHALLPISECLLGSHRAVSRTADWQLLYRVNTRMKSRTSCCLLLLHVIH